MYFNGSQSSPYILLLLIHTHCLARMEASLLMQCIRELGLYCKTLCNTILSYQGLRLSNLSKGRYDETFAGEDDAIHHHRELMNYIETKKRDTAKENLMAQPKTSISRQPTLI